MKSAWIALVAVVVLGSCLEASPVVYQKVKVGRTWSHVVTVNLDDPNVRVTAGIAKRGRGSSETFSSMMTRTAPKAAITGTFFDTRSLLPIGDIAIDGQVVHSGYFRTTLCITPEGKAQVVSRPRGGWKGTGYFDTLMCGGITLVKGGGIVLAPKSEGFRDRALFRPNSRTAVGITASGKLLFVAITRAIYLRDLAHVMIKLGCVDALALDGGSSTAFYYGGRSVVKPARKLTNLLLAYDKSQSFDRARCQLAPTLLASRSRIRSGEDKPIVLARTPYTAGPYAPRPFSSSALMVVSDATISAPFIHEPAIRSAGW